MWSQNGKKYAAFMVNGKSVTPMPMQQKKQKLETTYPYEVITLEQLILVSILIPKMEEQQAFELLYR